MINSFTRVWQKFIVFIGMSMCYEHFYKSENLFWRRVWKRFQSKVKSGRGGIKKLFGDLGSWQRSSSFIKCMAQKMNMSFGE